MYAVGLCLLTLAALFHLKQSSNNDDDVTNDEIMTQATDIDNNNNNNNNGLDIEGNDDTSLNDNLIWARLLSFVGLILICIGTGGIKPCVSAFGADQVVLNEDGRPSSSLLISESEVSSTTDTLKVESDKSLSQYSDETHQDVISIASKNKSDEDENHEEIRGSNISCSGDHHHHHHDQQQQQVERIREFFNSFYFCINVGALISFAVIPLIRAHYGFGAAFSVPTVCMIFALGIFLSQRTAYKHRVHNPNHQLPLSTVIQICFHVLFVKNGYVSSCCCPRQRGTNCHQGSSMDTITRGEHILLPTSVPGGEIDSLPVEDKCADTTTSYRRLYEDACQVLHLMPLMLFFPVFWMLYDQQGSVWTLQATRLNLYGLEPEQLQFLNPLEIMLFVPLFDRVVYPWLERHRFNIEPLRRMEYGMFLTAVAFCCSAWLESVVQNRPVNTVSLAWQIPQITILTVAEILLNVTGLEFAYSQAPANMQAVILAIFLFMTAIGDGLGAILFATAFAHLNSILSMSICAICMLINTALFSTVARRWEPYYTSSRTHHDDGDDNIHDDNGMEMRKIPL